MFLRPLSRMWGANKISEDELLFLQKFPYPLEDFWGSNGISYIKPQKTPTTSSAP